MYKPTIGTKCWYKYRDSLFGESIYFGTIIVVPKEEKPGMTFNERLYSDLYGFKVPQEIRDKASPPPHWDWPIPMWIPYRDLIFTKEEALTYCREKSSHWIAKCEETENQTTELVLGLIEKR